MQNWSVNLLRSASNLLHVQLEDLPMERFVTTGSVEAHGASDAWVWAVSLERRRAGLRWMRVLHISRTGYRSDTRSIAQAAARPGHRYPYRYSNHTIRVGAAASTHVVSGLGVVTIPTPLSSSSIW